MAHTAFFEGQTDGTLRVDSIEQSGEIELRVQGGDNVVLEMDDIEQLIYRLQFMLNDMN